MLLLLLLLGRLCCTRTSPSSTDKQRAEQHNTHTQTGRGRRADETKGMKKKHTGKRAWNGGMGVDFIFFLFGCCFFFSLACLRYVVCSIIFFCLPYAFVYRPVFGFVCFCVLHMRFFRSFGLFFPFACAALSQRRRQRRDSKRQQSQRQHNRSLPACLVSLSLTLILSFVAKRTPHSMSLSACCVVKRQLNKCMCVCACVLSTPLCICAHNFTVILKQLIKLTCYYFFPLHSLYVVRHILLNIT